MRRNISNSLLVPKTEANTTSRITPNTLLRKVKVITTAEADEIDRETSLDIIIGNF